MKITLPILIIIGPLLVVIVYNKSKPEKEVIKDTGIILLLQIIAFTYGAYQIYSQRVLIEVITYHGTVAVPTKEEIAAFSEQLELKKINQFQVKSQRLPLAWLEDTREILLQMQELTKEFDVNKIIKKTQQLNSAKLESKTRYLPNGFNDEFKFSLYMSMNDANMKTSLLRYSKKAMLRIEVNKEDLETIKNFMIDKPETYLFFPVKAKYGSAIKVLNKSGEPVTYLNVKRYKE